MKEIKRLIRYDEMYLLENFLAIFPEKDQIKLIPFDKPDFISKDMDTLGISVANCIPWQEKKFETLMARRVNHTLSPDDEKYIQDRINGRPRNEMPTIESQYEIVKKQISKERKKMNGNTMTKYKGLLLSFYSITHAKYIVNKYVSLYKKYSDIFDFIMLNPEDDNDIIIISKHIKEKYKIYNRHDLKGQYDISMQAFNKWVKEIVKMSPYFYGIIQDYMLLDTEKELHHQQTYDRNKYPKYLYKFRDCSEYNMTIIDNEMLWAGTVKSFKDKEDSRVCNELIEKFRPSDQEQEEIKRMWNLFQNKNILCLADKLNKKWLWKNHAADYTGFAIEIDIDKLFELKNPFPYLESLVPVKYYERKPKIKGINIDNPQENLKWVDVYINIFLKDYYLSWENEWRLVWKENNVPCPFISAVYLGKDISEKNEKILIESCKKKEIPVYKQRLNGHSFEYYRLYP